MKNVLMLVLTIVASATGAKAQDASAIDPATLRRSSFTWTQAEREFGFAHWDLVYSGRVIRRGAKPRPLPIGKPLRAFLDGTSGARDVDAFIHNEKVAGIIILVDGKLRLERYALGYRRQY